MQRCVREARDGRVWYGKTLKTCSSVVLLSFSAQPLLSYKREGNKRDVSSEPNTEPPLFLGIFVVVRVFSFWLRCQCCLKSRLQVVVPLIRELARACREGEKKTRKIAKSCCYHTILRTSATIRLVCGVWYVPLPEPRFRTGHHTNARVW